MLFLHAVVIGACIAVGVYGSVSAALYKQKAIAFEQANGKNAQHDYGLEVVMMSVGSTVGFSFAAGYLLVLTGVIK